MVYTCFIGQSHYDAPTIQVGFGWAKKARLFCYLARKGCSKKRGEKHCKINDISANRGESRGLDHACVGCARL